MKKLSLVAVAALATSGYALEALSDESLSATTGQDGITIEVDGTVEADFIYVHDNDGYVPADIGLTATDTFGITTPTRGAITMGQGATNFSIVKQAGNTGPLATINVDADGNGTSTGVLNVNIRTGAITINTGEIGVARSNRDAAATTFTTANTGVVAASYAKVMDAISVNISGLNANVQLGTSVQGAMIKLSGTITGGLVIDNFSVLDTNGYGATAAAGLCTATDSCGVKIGKLAITTAGAGGIAGTDLSLASTTIDIGMNGLVIDTGSATDLFHIGMESVQLGNVAAGGTPAIGDIEIGGLKGGTTFTIRGH